MKQVSNDLSESDAVSYGYSSAGQRVWKYYAWSEDTCEIGGEGGGGGFEMMMMEPPPVFDCTVYHEDFTYYVLGQGGQVLAEYTDLNGGPKARYIYAGTQRIAMIDDSNHVYYYLNDHLGSAAVVVDSAGNVRDKYKYQPFGGSDGTTANLGQSYRYTGKPLDEELDLNWYYYGARYYDPEIGRFLSVDPLSGKYPSTSPYAYCLNNPMNSIDPDGEDTYVVLYGNGPLSTDRAHQEGDQGNNFRDAANTRATEIRQSDNFNAKTDAVEVQYTGTQTEFAAAINTDYDSGPIASIDVFSHGYPASSGGFDAGGLNLGGTEKTNSERLVTESTVNNLSPDLAPGATITLSGCNTAMSTSTAPSIAKVFANKFPGAVVRGYTGYTRFRDPGTATVHVVPDGGELITVPPDTQ